MRKDFVPCDEPPDGMGDDSFLLRTAAGRTRESSRDPSHSTLHVWLPYVLVRTN